MNSIIRQFRQFVCYTVHLAQSRLGPLFSSFAGRFQHSKPYRNGVLLMGILSPVLIITNCKGGGDEDWAGHSTRSSQELIDTICDCTVGYSFRSRAQIETQELRDQCVKELVANGPGALDAIRAQIARIGSLIDEGRQRGIRYGVARGNPRAGANMIAEVDARYLPPLESLKAAAKAIEGL